MNYKFSDKVMNLKPSAIREILKMTGDPNIISFAAGNPAPDAFPVDEIRRITKDILDNEPIAALQYSITEGYVPLRETVKTRLAAKKAYTPGKDDVVITSGGQQASELACKSFLNEGDTLIAESPSFVGCLNAFRSYNANLVGVPMDSEGMRMDLLEKAVRENSNVKLIYLIPNFQNPSGTCMSEKRRKEIYEFACREDIVIIEDDPYGELRFEGENIPTIKSLDTEGRVIYCGSFSKVISPGMRVGFVSCNSEIISKIVVCKQVSDVHSNILAQMICHRILTQTDFEAHLERLRGIYRRKYNIMAQAIKDNFPAEVTVTHPQGGLFIWATLPEGCDMPAFCRKAVENGVAVVPGTAFTAKAEDKTSSFRLNFSTPTDEQLVKGCEILGKLLREQVM